jgi:hypothetical protein
MDFLYTTFPISAVTLVVIAVILTILSFTNIVISAILLFLSATGSISIKPILKLVDLFISLNFKSTIQKIKSNIRESFPVKGNLDIQKPAIYSFHPHGIFSLTHAFHSATEITHWPYKNIRTTTHSIITEFPFLKDFMNAKIVSSQYESMKGALEEGKSLSISLGGTSEQGFIQKNKITAIVKKRRGIFRLSLETGVPIVPVLSYGENEIFSDIYISGFLGYLSNLMGINSVVPIPSLSSLLNWCSIYKEPLKEKIYTYIGDPVEVGEARQPSEKEIVELREKYIVALHALYKKTRPENFSETLNIA